MLRKETLVIVKILWLNDLVMTWDQEKFLVPG